MNNKKIIVAFSVSVLIAGMTILFSYIETPKILGLFLVILSSIVIYLTLRNEINKNINPINTNINNLILGLALILIDLSYNAYSNDELRYFDYGVLLTGLLIIFLNVNKLNFFMRNKFFIDFTTYFLFIFILLYGFFISGITVLLQVPKTENPILFYMTENALNVSAFFANFIRPTTITDNTLNFGGFQVGVWYPCSGVESITVFISAIIAFFIATKEKNMKKIILYSVIGIIFLYFMNILRIIILLIVGHDYGNDALLFVHYNLGWIMFVFGMMVFWMLAFKNMKID